MVQPRLVWAGIDTLWSGNLVFIQAIVASGGQHAVVDHVAEVPLPYWPAVSPDNSVISVKIWEQG